MSCLWVCGQCYPFYNQNKSGVSPKLWKFIFLECCSYNLITIQPFGHSSGLQKSNICISLWRIQFVGQRTQSLLKARNICFTRCRTNWQSFPIQEPCRNRNGLRVYPVERELFHSSRCQVPHRSLEYIVYLHFSSLAPHGFLHPEMNLWVLPKFPSIHYTSESCCQHFLFPANPSHLPPLITQVSLFSSTPSIHLSLIHSSIYPSAHGYDKRATGILLRLCHLFAMMVAEIHPLDILIIAITHFLY